MLTPKPLEDSAHPPMNIAKELASVISLHEVQHDFAIQPNQPIKTKQ